MSRIASYTLWRSGTGLEMRRADVSVRASDEIIALPERLGWLPAGSAGPLPRTTHHMAVYSIQCLLELAADRGADHCAADCTRALPAAARPRMRSGRAPAASPVSSGRLRLTGRSDEADPTADDEGFDAAAKAAIPVSYTHMTLPTNREV